jgi:osmotically-inducible protein OsmY
MTATLKGTVHSNKDRSKALSVARGFEGVKSVKDIIFVIEP